ncbi:hypothetical protein HZH68_017124 [Vespula germanica]|uniref:Uncharacterized protein n=1 Tax=Vespula germanica TaxID=30212 RepID=A0A834MPS6_VESGE|nr:hypothetical protein HZH68_017124 [Vespula germanica]
MTATTITAQILRDDDPADKILDVQSKSDNFCCCYVQNFFFMVYDSLNHEPSHPDSLGCDSVAFLLQKPKS